MNTRRLEQALRNAEFVPDGLNARRWVTTESRPRTRIRFELLADLDTEPAEATVSFDECDALGAVNLRGTGFASRDVDVRELRTRVGGVLQTAEINVTGLGGFLLAKCAAARSRRKPKDWYDIAFVLLHNDAGGVDPAAEAIRERFGPELPSVRTSLDDLLANFADPTAQGPRAYAEQMRIEHPDLDRTVLAADAVLAVARFHDLLVRDRP